MYPWVKATLATIILSFILLICYIFRNEISELLATDEQEQVTEVTQTPTPDKSSDDTTKKSEPITDKKATVKPQQPTRVADKIYTKAELLFVANKIVEARDLLWKEMSDKKLTEDSPLFWQYAELLDKINTVILFSDIPTPEKIIHKVKSGDYLSTLAKLYKTTVSTIQKSNNIPLERTGLQIGQVLKIYPGMWSIKVIKSKFKLILFDQNRVFKVYNVSTGKQDRTPVATFKIKTKRKNPDWNPPGRLVKFGDPENPLGTRWMGLDQLGTDDIHTGYGIHGTKDPDSIGSMASNGCIRLRNEEVEELFDILPYGVVVEIVE